MSDFSNARGKMVDGQVRPSDVTDIAVLDALLVVERENFVPDQLRPIAYLDNDIDLGGQGDAKSFMIKPVVLARMLQAAEIKPTDKVLVVGCASGYSAAVIAMLAGQVVSVDHTGQAKAAAAPNVTIVKGAATAGCAAQGPFDVIVMAGSTEIVPTELYAQLSAGGRLVAVSALVQPSRAVMVTHTNDDFGSRPIFDATAPVIPGFEHILGFVF